MSMFDIGPYRGLRADEREDAPAPTYGELWRSSWNEARRATNFDAHLFNQYEAYNAVNDRIKAATGEALSNPFGAEQGPLAASKALFAFSREAVNALDPVTEWRRQVGELRARHADKLNWDDVLAEPDRMATAAMKKAREDAQAISDRFGLTTPHDVPLVGNIPYAGPLLGMLPSLGYNLATRPAATMVQLGAGFGAQFTSPADAGVNLVSFGVGGAAKSLLRNAVNNGLSNMAGQMVLSAPKQLSYRDAGLPYGVQVWAEEVAAAGGAGLAIDLLARAPLREGIKRFGADTPAGTTFSRNTPRGGLLFDAVDDATPTARPRMEIPPETVKRAEAGDIAATKEILEASGEMQRPEVRYAVEQIENHRPLDQATIDVLIRSGFTREQLGVGLRTISDAMTLADVEAAVQRAIADGDPVGPMFLSPRQVLDPPRGAELLTIHAERIARSPPRIANAVRDGLDAGLPSVMRAVEAAAKDGAPIVLDPRTEAETRMHSGKAGPVEIADAIRQWPELADDVPEMPALATARSLARMDGAAYASVREGDIHPDLAKLVAERVPREQQARMVANLAQAKPKSIVEGADLIEAMKAPRQGAEPAPRASALRIDDPVGPDAVKQTEHLRNEAGRAYTDAVAPIEERRALEARVETLKGELATAERTNQQYADPESGEALRDGDLDSIIEMWRYVRDIARAPKPKSVIEFLRARGGVNDDGGDIRHTIGRAKDRPGLISTKGIGIDEATLLAWEAGYFHGEMRPTPSDLLEAIDRDHRGDRVYTVHDLGTVDDMRVAREMEIDLEQVGIAGLKSEDAIRAYFTRRGNEGAGSGQAAAASENFAKLRAELHEAETRLAELNRELIQSDDGGTLYRMAMRAVAEKREADVFRALDDALRFADRVLPDDTRVDVRPDAQMVRESGGARYQIDASSDPKTGHIELALHALDPAAKIGHEAVHTLVTRGLISPDEVKALAKLARDEGTFGNEATYREAYKDRADPERLIEEEAAASYIEARIRGKAKGIENTTIARIQQFIERLKNLLNGYGFQSREDVVQALMRGDMARREARADWGREAVREGKASMAVAAEKGVTLPGGDQIKGVPLFAIKAFHGSPHDFDRFDMGKIGTGEGGQAFGFGLYFAESQGVARSYRDALGSQRMKDGTPFDERNPAHWAAEAINRAGDDRAKASQLLAAEMTPDMKIYEGARYQRLLRAKGMIERGEQVPEIGAGRMYEVRINADPKHFLDWDKPLSQQSETVREAIEKVISVLPADRTYDLNKMTAGQLLNMSSRGHVEEALREYGVPGIRYKDGMSRGTDGGTTNFVIFDDKLIEITHKDGVPVKGQEGDQLYALRDLFRSRRDELRAYRGADVITADDLPGRFSKKPPPSSGVAQLYHATNRDFERFDMGKSQDFGIHFGTAEQAANRITATRRTEGSRIIPATVSFKNAITLPDVGYWGPSEIGVALMKKGHELSAEDVKMLGDDADRINEADALAARVPAARRQVREAADIANRHVAELLNRLGYDAIWYRNGAEGKGWSLLVWNEGQVHNAITGDQLYSMRDEAPLKADLAAVDRMNQIGELIAACRG